jgi:hypothetical protein
LRAAFADVLNIMQQICVAADEDSVPKPLSAQQRFVGALQAALHAAAEAGLDTGGDEHRWEGPGAAEALAADLVHDPASGLFWRNVRARASAQSQASAAHAMRRFARRECAADPEASLETSLHPPLTLPRQPRDQPPAMEPPQARQPGRVAAPAAAAHSTAVPDGAAAPVAIKTEPLAAQQQGGVQQPAVSVQAQQPGPLPVAQQPVEDLYGDLDLRARGSAAAGGRPGPVAQQQPPSHSQPGGTGQQSVQQTAAAAQPPMQPATAGVAGQAPGSAAAQQPVDVAAGDLKTLLSNPAALQALLKDPAQLQRLLEKHPALITLLKSTLGQK